MRAPGESETGRGAPGAPPPEVLTAFGVTAEPVPLRGGQRTVWRAGGTVLKPLDVSDEELAWQAAVLTAVDGARDVRVAPPVRAADGRLAVGGWTAWRHEPGAPPTPGDYPAVVAAGRALHRHLADLPRPAFLDRRDHVWARADRAAWGEEPVPATAARLPHVQALLAARRPVDAPAQVVHGDLTDNVHLHPARPPLVLDLTAYWRPVGWATAVVAADAVVFRGAPPGLLARAAAAEGPAFPQLLVRALLFRAVADHLLAPGRAWARWFAPAVRRAVDLAGG
ncbi:MAG TPA: TIGR02569 family protein [Actinomycetaceae bacterium]|nr:TIGR02569 family protein [Actinomycetaceae bacterium]